MKVRNGGDHDRRRPATGLAFQDDGDAPTMIKAQANWTSGIQARRRPMPWARPRIRSQGNGPDRPEQVEPDVAVAEASEALGDEGGDLVGVEVVGAVGGHDVAAQEDVAASGGGDGAPCATMCRRTPSASRWWVAIRQATVSRGASVVWRGGRGTGPGRRHPRRGRRRAARRGRCPRR